MAARQKGTAELTVGILGRIWAIGCLGLFLLFWIPFAAIIFYAFAGLEGSVIAGVAVALIVASVASKVSSAKKLWRCAGCMKTIPAGSGNCPFCRVKLNPPT